MQRQSLGSPGSRLHGAPGIGSKADAPVAVEDEKRKDKPSSLADDEDDDHHKPFQRHLRAHSSPHRLIHLIPVLTFLCFLILYLCSHDPFQSDLADFHVLQRLTNDLDSAESQFGQLLQMEKGDAMRLRSLQNLQEIGRDSRMLLPSSTRPHRKLGTR